MANVLEEMNVDEANDVANETLGLLWGLCHIKKVLKDYIDKAMERCITFNRLCVDKDELKVKHK